MCSRQAIAQKAHPAFSQQYTTPPRNRHTQTHTSIAAELVPNTYFFSSTHVFVCMCVFAHCALCACFYMRKAKEKRARAENNMQKHKIIVVC